VANDVATNGSDRSRHAAVENLTLILLSWFLRKQMVISTEQIENDNSTILAGAQNVIIFASLKTLLRQKANKSGFKRAYAVRREDVGYLY
jgi:hypothetical protein